MKIGKILKEESATTTKVLEREFPWYESRNWYEFEKVDEIKTEEYVYDA